MRHYDHDATLGRGEAFSLAVKELQESEQWGRVDEADRLAAIRQLSLRACVQAPVAGGLVCIKCKAVVGQIDSDLAALAGFRENAEKELERLAKSITGPIATPTPTTAVESKTQKVALKSFFSEPMDSEEAVNLAVARLKEHLLDLVRKKVKLIVE